MYRRPYVKMLEAHDRLQDVVAFSFREIFAPDVKDNSFDFVGLIVGLVTFGQLGISAIAEKCKCFQTKSQAGASTRQLGSEIDFYRIRACQYVEGCFGQTIPSGQRRSHSDYWYGYTSGSEWSYRVRYYTIIVLSFFFLCLSLTSLLITVTCKVNRWMRSWANFLAVYMIVLGSPKKTSWKRSSTKRPPNLKLLSNFFLPTALLSRVTSAPTLTGTSLTAISRSFSSPSWSQSLGLYLQSFTIRNSKHSQNH